MESIKICDTCKHINIPVCDYPCNVCDVHTGDFDCWEPVKSEPAPMTREECEREIMEHAKAIRDIYKQYRGNARYLGISIVDGNIDIYNSHWQDGEDYDKPINVYCGERDE